MYHWIPTPCLNAFGMAVPTSFYIFGNVFIINMGRLRKSCSVLSDVK